MLLAWTYSCPCPAACVVMQPVWLMQLPWSRSWPAHAAILVIQLAWSCSWLDHAAGLIMQLAWSCSWPAHAASLVKQLTWSCSWLGCAADFLMQIVVMQLACSRRGAGQIAGRSGSWPEWPCICGSTYRAVLSLDVSPTNKDFDYYFECLENQIKDQ